MSTKKSQKWLMLVLFLALIVMACGNLPTVTEVASPVATEEPTRATKEPKESVPTFELSDKLFTHSSGAFAIYLPKGWESEERDDGVFAEDADSTAALDVSFSNLGVQLDKRGFDTYIDAVENNWFSSFEDYSPSKSEIQDDGSILRPKTVTLDGTSWMILSYYWQEDTIAYQQDFWMLEDRYDAYIDSLLEVANSMQTDTNAGAQSHLYAFRYGFTGPDNLFTFQVPYGWTYTREENDEDGVRIIGDTWTSPDEQMTVESLLYDEGQEVSKSLAGAFALELLRQFYANDLLIIEDKVQPDGSERLMWSSAVNHYKGTSFFETRGTTFLFLTWYVDDDHYDVYEPVWIDLVDSYDVP
ncbi:MAG: hypothetical protein JXB07_05170 [Anaerolineae bacterium]|nr:hypothetical protein [Anaerolineae bacterium]